MNNVNHLNDLIALSKSIESATSRHENALQKIMEQARACEIRTLSKDDRAALMATWYTTPMKKIKETKAKERTTDDATAFAKFDAMLRKRYSRLAALLKAAGWEIEQDTRGGKQAKPASDKTDKQAKPGEISAPGKAMPDALSVIASVKKLAALYSPDLKDAEYKAFQSVLKALEGFIKHDA